MGLFNFLFNTSSNTNVKSEPIEKKYDDIERQNAYERAILSEGLSLKDEPTLRKDRDFVMSLLDRDKKIYIEHFCEEFRDDKEIVIKALEDEADNIKYASERLKNDPDVVLAEMHENDNCLTGYEGERIIDDYDFIMKLIKDYNWRNIKFASKRLRNNKDICREAYKRGSGAKDYFGNEVLLDSEFMQEIEKY